MTDRPTAAVFAYAEIGVTGLECLEKAGYDVRLLATHRPNPGENVWYRLPEDWARRRGIRTIIAEDVEPVRLLQAVAAANPGYLFSFMYRNLLPDNLLQAAPHGAFNLHPSLLPAYRGRAPINWVLVNGENETGVTLHKMVRKADAGDIAAQERVAITLDDTALTLHDKLNTAARAMLEAVLPAILNSSVSYSPQNIELGSYFGRRTPADGALDWNRTALQLHNLVRAVTRPWPGAFRELPDGRKLFVWRTWPRTQAVLPGVVHNAGGIAVVGCGQGSLELHEIELDGTVANDSDVLTLLAANGLQERIP